MLICVRVCCAHALGCCQSSPCVTSSRGCRVERLSRHLLFEPRRLVGRHRQYCAGMNPCATRSAGRGVALVAPGTESLRDATLAGAKRWKKGRSHAPEPARHCSTSRTLREVGEVGRSGGPGVRCASDNRKAQARSSLPPLACALQEVRDGNHCREPSTDSLVWLHLQPSAQQLVQFCGSGHNGGRVNGSDHAGREAIHKVRLRLAAAAP